MSNIGTETRDRVLRQRSRRREHRTTEPEDGPAPVHSITRPVRSSSSDGEIAMPRVTAAAIRNC
jgi:hypothetical protein